MDQKWLDAEHDIKEFFDDSPDRSIAISLPTILENRVEQILRVVMRDDATLAAELFKPMGALGPFGVKIRIAYMLRLIDHETFRDLELVVRIRNDFAHKLSVKTFDDEAIRSRIKQMHWYSFLVSLRDELAANSPDPQGVDGPDSQKEFVDKALSTMRESFRMCVRLLIGDLHERQLKVAAPVASWLGTLTRKFEPQPPPATQIPSHTMRAPRRRPEASSE